MTTLSPAREVPSPASERPARAAGLITRVLASEWLTAALIFLFTRALALAGAYVGIVRLIHAEPARNKGWAAELGLMWDAAWYVTTAQNGYHWQPSAEGGTNVAFPPLFPAMISVLSHVLGWLTFGWDWGNREVGSWVAAGALISNTSFFVALALLIRLLSPRLGRPGAAFVALALAALPLAFFFSAIYTEGPFLMLVLGSLLVARSDWSHKWIAAGAVGLLASLLKFGGLLVFPLLLVEYLSQTGWRPRRIRLDIVWAGLVPLGLALYMGFLWLRFGNPLAFTDSEYKGWGHQASWFWGTYWDDAVMRLWNSLTGALRPEDDWVLLHGSGNRLYAILDVVTPPLMLAGGILARKKLLASEWVWLGLGILYPLSSGTSNSLARYMLPLWPGLIWLGMLGPRWRWLQVAWILGSLGLLVWCSSIYGNGKWIG